METFDDGFEMPLNEEDFTNNLAKEYAQELPKLEAKAELKKKRDKVLNNDITKERTLVLSSSHYAVLVKEIIKQEFNEDKVYSCMDARSDEWRALSSIEKSLMFLKAETSAKKQLERNEANADKRKVIDKIHREILDSTNPEVIVKKLLDSNPIYYDSNKLFWIWNKDKYVWELCDDTDTLVIARSIFDIPSLARLKNDIVDFIKIIGRERKPLEPPKSWIQFGSKIIDISNGKEFNATPEYFFTNSLPYLPNWSEDTPTLDLLFDSWVGRENRETLYEIIAYCCYRDYPIHHLFCFIGSGSNGKSTFLSLLNKFLGIKNCCSTSLDKLCDNNFAAASLYKKLVCIMGETNFSTMKRTELLKKLTGQDLIDFEFKNKMPFTDVNYAKLIISTNTLPETTDRTDGFYRRWVTIDFPFRFSGDLDVLSSIPEWEFNNLSRRCINILSNLISQRRFTNVGKLEDRKKKYEEKSNPLPKFIEQFVDADVDGSISKWEFKERFNTYLKQNNLRIQSDVEIGMRMKELDYDDKKITVDGKSLRYWINVKWKDQKVSSSEVSL